MGFKENENRLVIEYKLRGDPQRTYHHLIKVKRYIPEDRIEQIKR